MTTEKNIVIHWDKLGYHVFDESGNEVMLIVNEDVHKIAILTERHKQDKTKSIKDLIKNL